MRSFKILGIAALIMTVGGLTSVSAQTAPPSAGAATTAPAPSTAAKPARRTRSTTAGPTTKREPTVGQMAARERQKKCGAEWKVAKAAGKTGGLKWPQYWSQCNTRLKGGSHV